uniref:non-specific serine/threonine protein kinase n=1 Tax=Anthurium amnicola TaxID=1678845 RepID=A0A1D1ZIU3_9ARAE
MRSCSSPQTRSMEHTRVSLINLFLCSSLFISSLAWPALSADLPPEDCQPRSCGNGVNVEYPFWIEGRQPDHCGYPSFKLACKGEAPVIDVYNQAYLVRHIFYDNQSFIVSSVALSSGSCPVPAYNLSLGVTPFRVNLTNRYLYFYLNCTRVVPGYSMIPCRADDEGRPSFVGSYPIPDQERRMGGCMSPVVFPFVDDGNDDGDDDGDDDCRALLERGFLLSWEAVDCRDCRASGGRCRYDTTGNRFSCLCSDRSHAVSCYGPLNPAASNDDRKKKKKIIIGLSAGTGGFLLASFISFLLYRNKKMKARSGSSTLLFRTASSEPSLKKDPEMGSTHYPTHVFRYEELHEATNGFSPCNELGDGGFGTVYKGKLRDGRIVAVKRLYENNYKRVEQFLNEVAILNRLKHQNLVTLYGCTSRHSRELLLVYEFISNGTVADHLHGNRASEGALTWPIRLSIAIETATALAYLHAVDPQIIHRDVKTNNILLDSNFTVRVADFGLSRLFPTDATHVSTAPQGTPGYVDPEYHQCYQLTDKSDVYSFGVVLVELISSQPAVDITRHRHEINLSSMAMNKIPNGALQELVDPALGFDTDWEARRMIKLVAELAFRCLQGEKELRPTMEEARGVLQGIQDSRDRAERAGDVNHGTADDVRLLKNDVPVSPDSVMDKWASRKTTPNASG